MGNDISKKLDQDSATTGAPRTSSSTDGRTSTTSSRIAASPLVSPSTVTRSTSSKSTPTMMSNEISTTSSFRAANSVWMDGRSYHNVAKSSYLLPNDAQEADRLLQQHFAVRWAFNGNLVAPCGSVLDEGGKILDIGCAQGAWLLEMASEYPETQCVGIDISDLAPKEIKPRNVKFYLSNVLEGLPFADDTFDLVAMKLMVLAFRVNEWPLVFKEIMRVTKPGGWIQLIDGHTAIYRPGPCSETFNKRFRQMLTLRDMDADIIKRLDVLLKKAGAVNIKHDYKSCPMFWGGELGNLMGNTIYEVAVTFGPLWQKIFGIAPEDHEEMLHGLKTEWPAMKSYTNFHSYIAQKPMSI